MYPYKNKPEKIKSEKYNTDIAEPYIQEFIKDKLYLTWTNKPITVSARSSIHYFTIDDKLRYTSFFADFGPLNIAQVIKFCDLLNSKFKSEELKNKKIVLVSGPDNDRRANSAFLMCAYLLLVFNLTPDEAFLPIADIAYTFEPYRDAGYGPATYFITIKHCLQGLYKAIKTGLLDIDSLDVEEYEYYEKVENGDLNWITKKFIAFASPKERPLTHGMYGYDNPGNMMNLLQQDINSSSSQWYGTGRKGKDGNKKLLYPASSMDGIVRYFKENGVTCVVRLNNKLYDNRKFIEAGINHYEFYFPDGTIPPDNILFKFFELCETTPGSIAIHCKAGLGRTGTLIGAYLMKTYKFLAAEVIAFLRLMRPGCVVGPQQNYLQNIEQKLLRMKVNPLPYQISCIKLPISSIKRFNVNLPFSFVEEQNNIPMRNTNFSSNDVISKVYENNKKKNTYTPTSSSSSSSFRQRNTRQHNSQEFINNNDFTIPVQPRKNMEYQNSNMKNNINENTENFILKQIESNDLRPIPRDYMNVKSKSKSSLPSYLYGKYSDIKFLEDNIKNLSIVNGSGLNARSSSLQHFSGSNNRGTYREIREAPFHHKKITNDNQSFQRYYSLDQVIPNSAPSPSSSHLSRLRNHMNPPNHNSSSILQQNRTNNVNMNRNSPFDYNSRQNLGHLDDMGITSLSTTNMNSDGINYINHSNEYINGGSSRSSYYYNVIDADTIDNRRKYYDIKSLHSNMLKDNHTYYMDYIRGQKYGKKYN
jgi:cell division cycle 14